MIDSDLRTEYHACVIENNSKGKNMNASDCVKTPLIEHLVMKRMIYLGSCGKMTATQINKNELHRFISSQLKGQVLESESDIEVYQPDQSLFKFEKGKYYQMLNDVIGENQAVNDGFFLVELKTEKVAFIDHQGFLQLFPSHSF